MADSPETRQLKDINRHLEKMSGQGQMTDTLAPSETAALNQNVKEMMSNFEQLLDARLKKVVLTTDRSFAQTFGNLKGFQMEQNADQIAHLEDVIDTLEMNNQLLDKQNQNEFLREAEREKDLAINMETNEILEDILEKEDVREKEGKGLFDKAGGFLAGIFGGAGAGALLRGGLAFLGKAALAAGLVGLIAFGAKSFLEGWAEAGEDASFVQKVASGLGKALDDLTFGLFGEDFFSNLMDDIGAKIEAAIGRIQDIWNDATLGWGEKFDKIISELSFGLFDEADVGNLRAKTMGLLEDMNKSINDWVKETLGFDMNEAIQGFFEGVDNFIDDTVQLFTDPIGLITRKMRESKEEKKKEQKEMEAAAERGDLSMFDDEEEIVEARMAGELTPAQIKAHDQQRKERAKSIEADRKGLVDSAKSAIQWTKDSAKRIAKEMTREERIAKGQANLKALKEKRLAEQQERMKQEAMRKEAEAARKPDETGLFPPRNPNLVNSTNIQNINREDTSTINDDRSLQLQQAN